MKRPNMNWRGIRAIVRKDWRVVRENKGVAIPMLVIPLCVLVFLPALSAFAPILWDLPPSTFDGLDVLVEAMPAFLRPEFAQYNEVQVLVVLSLVYFAAPMYLVLPQMVASVIAADSFAGEKERKTLEALLHTPTTDGELLLAKLLSFLLYGSLRLWPDWD